MRTMSSEILLNAFKVIAHQSHLSIIYLIRTVREVENISSKLDRLAKTHTSETNNA